MFWIQAMRPARPVLVCLTLMVMTGAAAADDFRLRSATLTLGGVGTFAYEAAIAADGRATLEVRRGDVDDVLKSLSVIEGPPATGLRLAGPDEAAAAMASLPFPQDALSDPLTLLNALRGVPVEVRDPSGREVVLAGRMLGAIRDREPSLGAKEGLERTRVSLLTEVGMQQFVLEEAGAVRVADPSLQARLDAALAALQGQAAGDRRQIEVRFDATSGHTTRIAVVTPAPLWKATYRLALPRPGEASARLQGWAVLENATATDWSDVRLTLQSGNPVTFRQSLYAQADVDRPEIAVDRQARPEPRSDEAATPPPAAAPAPATGFAMKAARAADSFQEPAAPPAAIIDGIASTSFQLPIPVSLAVGESASVPFLDKAVPAESVDLLEFRAVHPLVAVRLTNTTGAGLPGGAVATMQGEAFAGDALLPPLPAGKRRLLTFAQDLAVTARWDQQASREVAGLTAAGGVAHLRRIQRTTTRIELDGAATMAKDVLLTIPRIDGASLSVEGATLSEQTATAWRLLLTMPAGSHPVVIATADRPASEDLALSDDPNLIVRLADLGALPAKARTAVERLLTLRLEASRHDAERERIGARSAALEAQEQRLRDNLAAVPAGDPLHGRLLRQLDAAETELQGLAADAERAAQAASASRDALTAAIAALTIED